MRQKTTEVTWKTKTAGFNMPWTNALHHRLPPEPTASLHNAGSPAERLLRAEPNRQKSRSVNGHHQHDQNKRGASCRCSQLQKNRHPPTW